MRDNGRGGGILLLPPPASVSPLGLRGLPLGKGLMIRDRYNWGGLYCACATEGNFSGIEATAKMLRLARNDPEMALVCSGMNYRDGLG